MWCPWKSWCISVGKLKHRKKKMSDDRSLASLSVSFSTHINTDCLLTAFSLLRHHGNTVQSQERTGNQKGRWCNDWTVLTMRGGSGACRVTMGTLGGITLSDTLLTDMLYRPFSRSFWTQYVEYIFKMQREEKSLESLIYPEVFFFFYIISNHGWFLCFF